MSSELYSERLRGYGSSYGIPGVVPRGYALRGIPGVVPRGYALRGIPGVVPWGYHSPVPAPVRAAALVLNNAQCAHPRLARQRAARARPARVCQLSDDDHRVAELVEAVTTGDDLAAVRPEQQLPPREGRGEHELGAGRAVQVRQEGVARTEVVSR